MPWNADGSRKESTLYKKSSFQLRSGNGASPAKVILGEEEEGMNTTLIDITKDMYESENQPVDTKEALEIIREVEGKKKKKEEEEEED